MSHVFPFLLPHVKSNLARLTENCSLVVTGALSCPTRLIERSRGPSREVPGLLLTMSPFGIISPAEPGRPVTAQHCGVEVGVCVGGSASPAVFRQILPWDNVIGTWEHLSQASWAPGKLSESQCSLPTSPRPV